MKHSKKLMIIMLLAALPTMMTASKSSFKAPVEKKSETRINRNETNQINSSKTSQPSTAQRYAIQARETIAQKTGVPNLRIIDSLAGTKKMSLKDPNEQGIEMTDISSKKSLTELNTQPTELNTQQKLEAESDNFDFLNDWEKWPENTVQSTSIPFSSNQSQIILERRGQMAQSNRDTSTPFFEQSTEHLGIPNTSPSSPSFLQRTTDSVNTLIGDTASAVSRYNQKVTQRQTRAQQYSEDAALISKNIKRPAQENIRIDNPEYKDFLIRISYEDMFTNLITPNNKQRSNGYPTQRTPIIVDIFNKMLIEMNIPESILTSPRFFKSKTYQEAQTNFTTQINKVATDTTTTPEQKQSAISQALTSLQKSLSALAEQLRIKTSTKSTPFNENTPPSYEESFKHQTLLDTTYNPMQTTYAQPKLLIPKKEIYEPADTLFSNNNQASNEASIQFSLKDSNKIQNSQNILNKNRSESPFLTTFDNQYNTLPLSASAAA